MNPAYEEVRRELLKNPRRWLVTGVAGFIGSHLLENLLRLGQTVTGLDNFSTGYSHNLDQVRDLVTPEQWRLFTFIQGDIQTLSVCREACRNIDFVLHEAALGSVPRSIDDPITTNGSNVTGFVNMLVSSRDAGVRRFLYAASSSTYGDHPGLPKIEEVIGRPLSPYAVTKYVNELYADVFARTYGQISIGFRYFNVFGARQDPEGAYAAVIPRWVASMIKNEPVYINGTGETSRDFCYIDNVVQINLLGAMTGNPEALNQVYNVAVGERTTLNQLYRMIWERLLPQYPHLRNFKPIYRDFRTGDVLHSEADIGKARNRLSYEPSHRTGDGLAVALDWYREHLS